MLDETEPRRKSGTATVFALLVSLLFGYAPAAHAEIDRSARLGPTELVKPGSIVRTNIRGQTDDSEPEAALLPPPPRIETQRLDVRPVAAPAFSIPASAPQSRPLAYRARAPPAA